MNETEQDFIAAALRNPYNAAILQRLPQLDVPGAYLVAGCLFQSVWNQQAGREVTAGIKDYDLFYFDASDLSWEAEDRVIQRARQLFADLPVEVEVRNQARVHLWYEPKFKVAYPPLHSSREAIDRFLICAACIGLGVRPDGSWDLYAPYGVRALYDGVLQANPNNFLPDWFLDKAQSYQARWPWLQIVPPMAARSAGCPAIER